MENIFEIYGMNSGLEYIKKVAPTVYEELLIELKEIDDAKEIESVEKYRKNLALGYAVLEAFEQSNVDVVVIRQTMEFYIAVKYLTKKSDIHISGEFDMIDDRCFEYCKNIETLVFEEGTMLFGQELLCHSKTLKEIHFPKSATMIGWRAFYNCTALNNVEILNSEIFLCEEAFWGCTNLKEVVLPKEMKNVAYNIFDKNITIVFV